MSDPTSLLAEARHGMSVLFGEIEQLRGHLADIPGEFHKLRDAVGALVDKARHIMSIHDDVAALLTEIDAEIDTLIAKKADGDAANADLKVKATTLLNKIKDAVASVDDPAPVPVVQSVGSVLGAS